MQSFVVPKGNRGTGQWGGGFVLPGPLPGRGKPPWAMGAGVPRPHTALHCLLDMLSGQHSQNLKPAAKAQRNAKQLRGNELQRSLSKVKGQCFQHQCAMSRHFLTKG